MAAAALFQAIDNAKTYMFTRKSLLDVESLASDWLTSQKMCVDLQTKSR